MEKTRKIAEENMRKEIEKEISFALHLLHEMKSSHEWTGGWCYLKELRPILVSLKTLLVAVRSALPLDLMKSINYYNFFVTCLSLVRVVTQTLFEKNSLFNRKLRQSLSERENFFEPYKSELCRKVGDIILVSKVCNVLERHLYPGLTFELFHSDCDVQNHFFRLAHDAHFGKYSTEDIVDLIPEVNNTQFETIMRLRKLKSLLIQSMPDVVADLPKVEFLSPEVEWSKRIDEMIKMATTLLQHGYSFSWRAALVNKLNKLRPIVAQGNTSSEFEEAHAYLASQYYRIRKAYDMHMNKLEKSETFLKKELEYSG